MASQRSYKLSLISLFVFLFMALMGPVPADDEFTRNPDPGPNNPGPRGPNSCSTACCAKTGSDCALQDGNFTEDYRLPAYRSLGISRSLRFVYNSTTADVRPIIAEDTVVASFVGMRPSTVSGRLMIDGEPVSFPQGGEIFYNGGLTTGGSVRLALPFDANDRPTGLHSYVFSVFQNFANRSFGGADMGQVSVNNQRNSPFGAGWGLDGLQRLYQDRSGQALITEGNGAAHIFSLRDPVETGLLNAARTFPAGNLPSTIVAKDFNRDGNLDLAVTTPSSVEILLGDGRGGFSAPRSLPFVGGVWASAVDDFNGDSIPDLAVVHGNPAMLSIRFGNGDGNFCQPPLSCPPPTVLDGGAIPTAIAVGDFNGDGMADLVTANANLSNLFILLGNGDGRFQPPRVIPISGINSLSRFAVGNLNLDGSDDVAISDLGGFSVLLNRGDGTGDFQPPRHFAIDPQFLFQPIAIGDFNNDGNPDIAVGSLGGNLLVIALGNGKGGFDVGPNRRFDLGASNDSHAIAVADFNQDEKLDLAVMNSASRTISVLLGDGRGNLTAAKIYVNNHFQGGSLGIVAGDFNNDRRLDLVAPSGDREVSLMLGDGTGNFTGARYFNHGIPTNSSAVSIAAGDFNHDGNPDVVMADCCNPRLSIMLGDGQGSLGPPRLVPLAGLSGRLQAVAIGDFDGDGHPDLAVADNLDKIAILLGNGDGTFRPAGTFPAGGRPSICDRCLAVGDFNRDGKPDLVIGFSLGAPSFQMGVSVLLGNGDGTFQPPRLINIAEQGQGNSIAVGDFNGDGKPDLAVASVTSTDLFILLGDGNGGFVLPPRRLSLGAGAAANAVAVGDFNGDGKEDLAVTTAPASTVVIFIGNGDGTFQLPGRSFPLVPPGSVSVSRSIQVGDFNRDGRLDLAVLNWSGVSIFLGDGQGNFPTRLEYGAEAIPRALVVSDFNSDGKSDVALTTGGQSGTLSFLLSFPDSSPGDYSQLVRETGSVCGASFAFTRTMKDGTKIHFNTEGRHLATVDRNSNTTCYRYNADGTLASITDPVGLATTLTYTDGHLSSVRDPAGRITTFTVDEAGNLTSIIDPAKAVAQYAYDDDHHLVARTDPRDFTFNYRYNFAGRFESSSLPDGSTRRVSAAQMAGLVDPASGRGTRQNPVPHTLTSDVTSRYTDGNNNTTIYTMDSLGGATSGTDAENRRTETLKDGNGNTTKITEANGAITINTYDVRGNLLSNTRRAINATTTYTHAQRFNQVTSIRDPRGNTKRFEYDARGNLITEIDALNNRTTRTYDARGLLLSVRQNGINQPTTYTYDARGNLRTTADPLGNVTTREYDEAGKVTRLIGAEGRATVYTYDAMNRLTSVTDARGGVTNYTYEPGCCGGSTGLLSSITDAEGRTTSFEYDSMGRLASIVNPLKQTKTFRYDGNGNLSSAIDARGRTITFEYDLVNQLRFKRRPLPDSTIEYRYDRVGNLVEVRESNNASVVTRVYDRANRLTSESMAGTILPPRTITYDYDLAGNRTRMLDPQGATLYPLYDELNRLRRLTNPGNQVTTFNYDILSRRSALTLANGTSTTYTYDDDSRLTSLVTRRGETTISSFQYTYDRVGNRRTMTEMAGQNSYTYDETYRLTNATHPQDFNPEELFTFDGVGNRLTSHLSETYVYDDANRLLQDDQFTYTYDANGNLISKEETATGSVTTYNYNSENQLTRVGFPDGTSAAYDYDGLRRRIRKNVNGITTKYIYDNEGILYELDVSNTPVARYTRGRGIDEVTSMDRGGQSFFYHLDALGSVINLTNNSGNVAKSYTYDVFGRIVQQVGGVDQPFTYTGREYDRETGLYYYRARYYDPSIGRFLSEDPSLNPGAKFTAVPLIPYLLPDSLSSPGQLHSYIYALNNPVNLLDPTGLQSTRLDCLLECQKEFDKCIKGCAGDVLCNAGCDLEKSKCTDDCYAPPSCPK